MKRYNALLMFVLQAFSIYIVCVIVLFTGAGDGYSAYFRGLGNFLFGKRWENVVISFVPKNSQKTTLADGHRATNISVRIDNKDYHYADGRPVQGELGVNSHLQGYLPTALFLALILATPLGWKQRMQLMGVGLVLLHVFIAVLLWFVIVGYTEVSGIGIYRFGDMMKGFVSNVVQVALVNQIGISFVVPMLIWLGCIAVTGALRTLLPQKKEITDIRQ